MFLWHSVIIYLGIAYDFPDSNGYGGNTTTSEACRKFYRSTELRGRLVDLCPPLYRNAFEQILFNDLIILRLISCRYRVLVEKIGILIIINIFYSINFLFIDELCKKQQLLCVEDIGSWVRFPDTLHEGYAHVADVMGEWSLHYDYWSQT